MAKAKLLLLSKVGLPLDHMPKAMLQYFLVVCVALSSTYLLLFLWKKASQLGGEGGSDGVGDRGVLGLVRMFWPEFMTFVTQVRTRSDALESRAHCEMCMHLFERIPMINMTPYKKHTAYEHTNCKDAAVAVAAVSATYGIGADFNTQMCHPPLWSRSRACIRKR